MPQPQLSQLKFGNRPIPGSGVVMPWLDLNDSTNWRTRLVKTLPQKVLTSTPAVFTARGFRVMGDVGPKLITADSMFDETGGGNLNAERAKLLHSGEQFLSYDNLSQVIAECVNFDADFMRTRTPYFYKVLLSFMARDPFMEDIAATTTGSPVALVGTTGGTANNFTITYAGGAFCRPVWTLNIPTGQPAVTHLKLQNTLSGEVLDITPPVYGAGAHAIVIDTNLGVVYLDVPSAPIDMVGSWPRIYPPPTTANTFVATLSCNAPVGMTLSYTFKARWEF